MPRKWQKSSLPESMNDRLMLAAAMVKVVPPSSPSRGRVEEIISEWASITQMAIALNITLTKHDYREFMLRKIGAKG
jgi:hypothetical protein